MDYLGFPWLSQSESGKTDIWSVRSLSSGAELGQVRWFGRWRCYAFHPEPDTVFNASCLAQVRDFCDRMTHGHRTEAKRAKP